MTSSGSSGQASLDWVADDTEFEYMNPFLLPSNQVAGGS